MSDEREDLDTLLHSQGWLRVVARAKQEWGPAAYAARLEAAALSPSASTEVPALVQSLRAVNALIAWPAERIAEVTRQIERASEPASMSRGGAR